MHAHTPSIVREVELSLLTTGVGYAPKVSFKFKGHPYLKVTGLLKRNYHTTAAEQRNSSLKMKPSTLQGKVW